ncbi:MAG: hypothetical protein E4H01_10645 [Lysobacterales bacterium]|nr:MAG: hypothetical protein E4H01_10645 [Xanthomonadales bacterium]
MESSRHVEVSIDGVKVADSRRPMMLFETGLPTPEMPKIAARLCFYDEKVDVKVDGILQERPRTKWS